MYRIKQVVYGSVSVCLASKRKCLVACAHSGVCARKPLIMRSQLRIKEVNKVMSLQQKNLTHNRALALLDYHNRH